MYELVKGTVMSINSSTGSTDDDSDPQPLLLPVETTPSSSAQQQEQSAQPTTNAAQTTTNDASQEQEEKVDLLSFDNNNTNSNKEEDDSTTITTTDGNNSNTNKDDKNSNMQAFEITLPPPRKNKNKPKLIKRRCTDEKFMVSLFIIASILIGCVRYISDREKNQPAKELKYYTKVDHWSHLRIHDIQNWCLNPSSVQCSSACLNPLTAQPRIMASTTFKKNPNNNHIHWEEAFYGNVREANIASTIGGGNTDIVFLGDSIVEGWKGLHYGKFDQTRKDNIPVFDSLFSKNYGYRSANYQALALGIAGDKTYNLLWRIQNGEIPQQYHGLTFDPLVWWIAIGTNDFNKNDMEHCSPEVVLMGIIRVVEEVRAARPHSLVVVNSILPRSEIEDGHLFPPKGRKYRSVFQAIMEVNLKLKDYCSKHHNLHYFDATSIFIRNKNNEDKNEKDNKNKDLEDYYSIIQKDLHNYYIPERLMGDYLHPTAKGYQEWGSAIVDEMRIIEEVSKGEKTLSGKNPMDYGNTDDDFHFIWGGSRKKKKL